MLRTKAKNERKLNHVGTISPSLLVLPIYESISLYLSYLRHIRDSIHRFVIQGILVGVQGTIVATLIYFHAKTPCSN
jgi:hypothetical protein